GDIVLRSKEGTLPHSLFRPLTHAVTFASFSPKLPASLTLANPTPPALRIIYGLEIPIWKSLDLFEDIVALAEAWDAPGPLSLLCSSLTAPLFLKEPIRLYGLTSRLQWDRERKIASMHTLSLPLLSEPYLTQLQRLASKDVLDLMILQRSRRDEFKNLIDEEMTFNAGNAHHFRPLWWTWQALKLRMVFELDKRPLGDTIMDKMDEWPEALACWSAKCPNKGCDRLNYDKAATMREIRSCMSLLPATV
ncbi:hypothetical protein JOM56_001465, partial [Amanita muscaria]